MSFTIILWKGWVGFAELFQPPRLQLSHKNMHENMTCMAELSHHHQRIIKNWVWQVKTWSLKIAKKISFEFPLCQIYIALIFQIFEFSRQNWTCILYLILARKFKHLQIPRALYACNVVKWDFWGEFLQSFKKSWKNLWKEKRRMKPISIECEDQLERLMSIQISNISLQRPVKGGQN